MSTSSIISHRFVPFGAAVAITAALGFGTAAVWPHSPHSGAPMLQRHSLPQPGSGLHDLGATASGGKVLRGF